jgi:hypothetical protein
MVLEQKWADSTRFLLCLDINAYSLNVPTQEESKVFTSVKTSVSSGGIMKRK